VVRVQPSETVLLGLLAAAPDALLAVDSDGRISYANEETERLFGWGAADLLGQPLEVLVPVSAVDVAQHEADPIRGPLGTGKHLSGRRKDGHTFPAEVSLRTMTDDAGSRVVLAAVRAATDRADSRADQHEQERLLEGLGQLAGGVAHDFNNLLGVILNYNMLLERRIEDPVAAADLREVRTAAERAADLTRRLLTFARRDGVNPEPLDLNEVVRASASTLEHTLHEQIELCLVLAPSPLAVVADRRQVEQIMSNLVNNARDALPSGGTLTITTEPGAQPNGGVPAAAAVLRVTDDGPGMEPAILARAFEPFFTTKARGEGTGLGLATVWGIVSQGGGDVRIESTIGAGTTVSVMLPGTGNTVQQAIQEARGG
jgi:PAS domain S-box-containing protein